MELKAEVKSVSLKFSLGFFFFFFFCLCFLDYEIREPIRCSYGLLDR